MEKIMFTPDAMIDAVQTSKKTFVNTFVTNPVIKTALVDFVDAQTAYTKKAVQVGTDTTSRLVGETVKSMYNSAQFDYSKFAEGIVRAYQNLNKPAA
jgi:hypothetical protein